LLLFLVLFHLIYRTASKLFHAICNNLHQYYLASPPRV